MVGKGLILALLPLISLTTAVPIVEHKTLEPRAGKIMGIADVRDDEGDCRGGRGRSAACPAWGQRQEGMFTAAGRTVDAWLEPLLQSGHSSTSIDSTTGDYYPTTTGGQYVNPGVVFDDFGQRKELNLPKPKEAAGRAAMARAPPSPKLNCFRMPSVWQYDGSL
ncbi:hypothetical protein MCOR25_006731 [Pyricularia grisea]|nr:hypothetical protein MCOR25_006731 [Pyricularia grisea]